MSHYQRRIESSSLQLFFMSANVRSSKLVDSSMVQSNKKGLNYIHWLSHSLLKSFEYEIEVYAWREIVFETNRPKWLHLVFSDSGDQCV